MMDGNSPLRVDSLAHGATILQQPQRHAVVLGHTLEVSRHVLQLCGKRAGGFIPGTTTDAGIRGGEVHGLLPEIPRNPGASSLTSWAELITAMTRKTLEGRCIVLAIRTVPGRPAQKPSFETSRTEPP